LTIGIKYGQDQGRFGLMAFHQVGEKGVQQNFVGVPSLSKNILSRETSKKTRVRVRHGGKDSRVRG
jgi:hypothetical protein